MEYVWILGGAIVLVSLMWFAALNTTEAKEARARESEALAEYERAGLQISRPFLREKVISGNHAGVRFEHYIIPGGKNTPARTVVSIPTTAPGEFHVCPETGGTAAFKHLGMVDEFLTGDAPLDRKYYFSGTTDEYVKAVFGVRENLERVRAIFAEGCDEMEKSGTHLTASKPGAGLLGIAGLNSIVEQLARLRLPPAVPGGEGKKFAGTKVLHAILAASVVITIFAGAGLALVRPPFGGWIAFSIAVLPVVTVLCAAMMAAAYFGLKGSSMAARGIYALLGSLLMLPVVLVCTLAFLNEQLDSTAAEEHEVRLMNRHVTTSKNSRFYHLTIASWRGGNHETLDVSADAYALAREGQVWRVRTRSGWLGHAWVESMGPPGGPQFPARQWW